jgi:glycosyltransferase involved in cell wall biosynthesis
MKVGLIGSIEGYGAFSWYTRDLYQGLLKEGIDVRLIWTKIPQLLLGQTLHHVLVLPRHILRVANKFDILHATQPGFTLCFPLITGPSKIVTFYDLFPILRPQDFSSSFKTKIVNFAWFSIWLKTSKNCDRIIAISSQTKTDLLKVGIPEQKISVVNLWVRPTLHKKCVSKNKTLLGYVGAISHRKDVKFLVRAFSEFVRIYPNSELWLCGSCSDPLYKRGVEKLVNELGLTKKVRFREFLSDEELSEVYSSLDCFMSGTLCEGFGMPILEAKRFGVPVVVRKEAIIPSEVKKYCLEADTPKTMAEKAAEAIEGKTKKIVARALAQASKFTLEEAVRQTVDIYRNCLK